MIKEIQSIVGKLQNGEYVSVEEREIVENGLKQLNSSLFDVCECVLMRMKIRKEMNRLEKVCGSTL